MHESCHSNQWAAAEFHDCLEAAIRMEAARRIADDRDAIREEIRKDLLAMWTATAMAAGNA